MPSPTMVMARTPLSAPKTGSMRRIVGAANKANAAGSVATRFKDRPRVEAAVQSTVAGAYRTLGRLDLALSHSQAAVEIVREFKL